MQLLEHFKELTLHPKNAEELKGLILQMAVQGKLTKQWRNENPNVESSSQLLEKIRFEKEKLIRDGLIKKEKPLEFFEESDRPDNLPNSWEYVSLVNLLIRISNGASGKQNEDKEGYPVSRIETISLSEVNMDKVGYTQNIPREKLDYYKLNDGDILLSHINSDYHVGKTAIIPPNIELYHGVNLLLLRFSSFIHPRFMDCVFNSLRLNGYFLKIAQHAIGQSSINQGKIKKIFSPLPPFEEQKAIVEVVNQLFAEVEQLEALTKERIQLKADFVTSALNRLTQAAEQDTASQWALLQKQFGTFFTEKSTIKKLREGILQLAVQGKLTRDWRALRQTEGIHIEHASTLLEKIKAEKEQLIKAKKIKKEKPLPEISEEEIPYELPKGWVWCRLTELTDVGTGSTPAKSNPSYYGGNIPWYTSSATNDEFAKIQDVMITEKALKETNCKVFPQGSLIIAMYGQGKTRGQISELVIPGATNQAIAAMAFFEESKNTKQYLKYYFQKFYHEIRLLAEGGAQPNLNVGKVKETLIPLPPIIEMNAIVEKVNTLMALCDKLEQEIETHQTTQKEWMQSCLREVVER